MSFSTVLNGITDRISGIYTKYNSAIIVAGGSGTRAGGETPKQFRSLCGVPVIVRTVNTFEKCKFIKEIILVCRKEDMPVYEGYVNKHNWKKVKLVSGGCDRQESVLNGFKAISDKSEYVYIHDGVRCLVTDKMIAKVGHEACTHGCAIAAQKATDTVKVKDGKGISTVDRDSVYLAQTPQVFMTEMYRAAAYNAKKNGFKATDDASLVEYLGFNVIPVDCGEQNIKITNPQDFMIAEAILKYRKTEERKK